MKNQDFGDRLSLKTKLAFGLGSMAESVALYTVATFAMLFYNQVLGVPAHLVGIALSAGLLFDGLTDPIIGSLSDRTRSRWGRRHPYMFAAPVPIAACLFAVFRPPHLGDMGLAIWCGVFLVAMRQAMTFFHTPHLALGGELTPSYTERSKVMAYNTFFGWAGGALSWWLALRLFFPSTPKFPQGVLNPEPWPRFAVTLAISVIAILMTSAWFTRDRIPFLPQPAPDTPRFSWREFARDIGRALSNRNYVWLLVAYFFLSMMNGLRDGLWLYSATFYWQLTSEQLSWFIFATFAGYLIGFFTSARLHGRFDKRRVIIVSALFYALGPSTPYVLALMGYLGPHTSGLIPSLMVLGIFGTAPVSILTISVMSALADIADENELKHGLRQEGVLFSARALFAKVDQAIGAVLAGAALTIIAFPTMAKPGHVPQVVLFNLLLVCALTAIPGLIAVFFYSRYTITRENYETTKAALAARKAGAGPISEAAA